MIITTLRRHTVTKEKDLQDIYYPVHRKFNPIRTGRPSANKNIIRRIIQGAVKVAYGIRPSTAWADKDKKPEALATSEQMEMVIHLIESLQPNDAIEVALASQFAISYIQAIRVDPSNNISLDLFEFGHKVLEALQKYRSKGAQQISVQYNVNQGQVVNIKNVEKGDQPAPVEEGTR